MRAVIVLVQDGSSDIKEAECIGFTSLAQAKSWMFDMGYAKVQGQVSSWLNRSGLRGQIFESTCEPMEKGGFPVFDVEVRKV